MLKVIKHFSWLTVPRSMESRQYVCLPGSLLLPAVICRVLAGDLGQVRLHIVLKVLHHSNPMKVHPAAQILSVTEP